MNYVIYLINILVQLITILVIVKVFLSYFMQPWHPVRQTMDRIVDPMLRPIQRLVPMVGMLDLSPIILIIVIQLIGRLIISALLAIFH